MVSKQLTNRLGLNEDFVLLLSQVFLAFSLKEEGSSLWSCFREANQGLQPSVPKGQQL